MAMTRWRAAAMACLAIGLAWAADPVPAGAAEPRHRAGAAQAHRQQPRERPAAAPARAGTGGGIDHSGRVQRGRASYYGPEFDGRRMASGRRFDPRSDAAASRTLPLGTTARVTNLRNGRSARVRVEDRGPRAAGRIADVSPKVADELGMRRQGVAPVEVAPIAVPQPDGGVRPGAGADGGGAGGR
jgi:rare lipoprotein A